MGTYPKIFNQICFKYYIFFNLFISVFVSIANPSLLNPKHYPYWFLPPPYSRHGWVTWSHKQMLCRICFNTLGYARTRVEAITQLWKGTREVVGCVYFTGLLKPNGVSGIILITSAIAFYVKKRTLKALVYTPVKLRDLWVFFVGLWVSRASLLPKSLVPMAPFKKNINL